VSSIHAGSSAVLGKLGSKPEYLPVPVSAPSFEALDAWLSQSTEWAALRAGPDWSQRFAHGAVHGFLFREPHSSPSSALCGALAPSNDSAGRQFPLALGAPLQVSPELLARPELLPFMLESVWAQASRALLKVLETGDPALGTDLRVELTMDLAEAASLYDEWAVQLPLVELWALLGPSLPEPQVIMRSLFETLAPVCGIERPETTLTLRLPLGRASGLALCFWIDLVRRRARWRETLPSLFWSHDGLNGAVLLHLGRAPKETLVELWMPSEQRDEIADLTAPPSPALLDALPPLSAPLLAALNFRDTPVAAFLALLST
jgi:type VI secretion system ImpM family protein